MQSNLLKTTLWLLLLISLKSTRVKLEYHNVKKEPSLWNFNFKRCSPKILKVHDWKDHRTVYYSSRNLTTGFAIQWHCDVYHVTLHSFFVFVIHATKKFKPQIFHADRVDRSDTFRWLGAKIEVFRRFWVLNFNNWFL